jgi:hypothetical protein
MVVRTVGLAALAPHRIRAAALHPATSALG